ncbi:hypothetical protein QFC20_005053 [Naganishia adeliensis]|uniref:Uncharacterized protein n=1 Tax=Naganishia adeliensis TaxID=92952 RepID=A0ACC2VT95_9TREE|nr:hypothetical protein QFC20_005053 [Naganishia adeliensis]
MAEYQEYLTFAIDLAKKAGEMIKDGQAKRFSHDSSLDIKANAIDLVTEVDQAVEAFISKTISGKYPSHKFIGEETYAAEGKMELTDEFTWIVDPIDGTTNPMVGCSIGLAHKRVPVVGVIMMPFMNQLYSARTGGGAFLNETTLLPLTGRPQPLESLQECTISFEWGSDRSKATMDPKLASVSRLAGDTAMGGAMVHGIRSTGASTAALVSVAAGGIDVYWDAGPYAWDVCAGIVIVQEAGGYFTGSAEDFEKGDTHIGDIMMNRRYCCIRAIAPTANESGPEKQKRIIGDLYKSKPKSNPVRAYG